MNEVNVGNLSALNVQSNETSTGNLMVSGVARFANPIKATIDGGMDINSVDSSNTINDSDYVYITDGTHFKKVPYLTLQDKIYRYILNELNG